MSQEVWVIAFGRYELDFRAGFHLASWIVGTLKMIWDTLPGSGNMGGKTGGNPSGMTTVYKLETLRVKNGKDEEKKSRKLEV